MFAKKKEKNMAEKKIKKKKMSNMDG